MKEEEIELLKELKEYADLQDDSSSMLYEFIKKLIKRSTKPEEIPKHKNKRRGLLINRDEYDIKKLAEILAIQADIEGMKVANLERESQNLAPAFGKEAFQQAAKDLRVAAYNDSGGLR